MDDTLPPPYPLRRASHLFVPLLVPMRQGERVGGVGGVSVTRKVFPAES
ncbi:hypothetical protein GS923_24265 [Rhodococcus hoagii]|nr:hypothetical protein [Prescottella equi]